MSFYSVSIPAYNEARRISVLLDFLLEELPRDVPLVVVNDGSTDGTREILRTYEPRIQVISHFENRGYAAAFNTCLSSTSTDVVVLLDADSIPLHGSIKKLVQPFQDPSVGATTGSHVLVNSRRGPANWLNVIIYQAKKLLDAHQHSKGELWHMNGLIMALRRSVIPQVETKETNQDAFLGWLTLQRGYKTVLVPGARSKFKAPDTLRDYIQSRMRVCRGHVILGMKYNISKHTFTEVAFPLYCMIILKATPRDPRGFMALLLGVVVDVWFRIYWSVKYRVDPLEFEGYRWAQIESTKQW